MKEFIRFFAVVLVTFFVLLPGIEDVYAQQPAGDNMAMKKGMTDMAWKGMGRHEMMFKDLDLTEEQQMKVKECLAKEREEGAALLKEMAAKKDLLREELSRKDLDMEEVKKIHGEIKVLMGQREDAQLDRMIKMREILTPEKFAEFQKKMGSKRGQFEPHKNAPAK